MGLPFTTAKIQFCALGCQEECPFWRRFNIWINVLKRCVHRYLSTVFRGQRNECILRIAFRVFVNIIRFVCKRWV